MISLTSVGGNEETMVNREICEGREKVLTGTVTKELAAKRRKRKQGVFNRGRNSRIRGMNLTERALNTLTTQLSSQIMRRTRTRDGHIQQEATELTEDDPLS